MKAITLTSLIFVTCVVQCCWGKWQWQGSHYDWDMDNTVGSCYEDSFTYYKSFQCETVKGNCNGGQVYCDKLTDPQNNYQDRTNYYLKIILPTVLGGLCLIGCCCTICFGYYCIQCISSIRENRKRAAKRKATLKRRQS